MSYLIELPAFAGPFDLLFHLIEQDEINIWDIPIARITEQYLAYIDTLTELDLDVAGEYLVMAATLLAIKARLLLPAAPSGSEEEGEAAADPRLALVARLLEYRQYKEAGQALRHIITSREKLYPRGYNRAPGPAPPIYAHPVGDATTADLLQALRTVLSIYRPPAPEAAIPREYVSVDERVSQLRRIMARRRITSFQSLLPPQPTRRDVVVTFLALLELVRTGFCAAVQEQLFGPIELAQPAASAGMQLADGRQA